MPKLIDYPRTSYTSAWEVAEVVDDTGGKCALETCARKLNRKVSGSFKAIVGSAVKFGLLTSKREILTTTTLFRRIKHAYDKQEELLFHREAFLTPPLFTQVCRKFRSRELPAAMLDVLLIREFDVEEINAQSVAKAFIDGAHMVGILDEHNMVADIDQLAARQAPRRELASPTPGGNTFRQTPPTQPLPEQELKVSDAVETTTSYPGTNQTTITTPSGLTLPSSRTAPTGTSDAIANLFGLTNASQASTDTSTPQAATAATAVPPTVASNTSNQQPVSQLLPPASYRPAEIAATATTPPDTGSVTPLFRLQLTGPGLNTDLDVTDADDLMLVRALLDKIERQLRRPH